MNGQTQSAHISFKEYKLAITTTCGHVVRSIDDVFDLQVKGYDEVGNRIVSYECCCHQCANEKELGGEIIHNQHEEYEWVNGISDDPQNTLIDYAKRLISHSDKDVASFASRVYTLLEHNNNDHKLVVARIDTNNEFTLSIKDSLITGVGKVLFGSITEAILCLNSAHVTWKKDNISQLESFLQYCSDAAFSIKQGNKSFVRQDSSYMLTLEVMK